jgi:PAS domain S-box-containing protein
MNSTPAADDLKDLFENAPCGYLSLEPSGRIERVNATFLRWTGFSAEDLAGKKLQDLLNIAGRIFFETHFAPLLRMQGFFNEVALELMTRDGRYIPVLVNAVERRGPAGEHLFTRVTIFNATDRRRYESELLQARALADTANAELRKVNETLEARIADAVAQRMQAEESLRQSQKMEAIGQLTGGVAHDFNNLLTVILGGLDATIRHLEAIPPGPTTARVRRSCEMGRHAARRAATLTTKLLAFSRRQILDPRSIDPNALVCGLADLLQRTLGETVSLETVSGAGLWRAFADPAELENVLVNLAVNARDAMPQGGRLTIETSNALLDDDYVASIPEPVQTGQYVMIAVSDTGHGMDEATLARVFEPFFTTKEAGKGTGLGLSQVYGFARQSGGYVRIYSELGEGTTVKLYLPRASQGAAVEAETISERKPARDGAGELVLVVEDHDDLRAFSVNSLRELGYEVMEAKSGRGALELLQTDAGVALLFTDVVLPDGLDGRALADEARRRRPGLKILFTTGYTRNAIVHNGRLDPGVHLLTKPFTFASLAAKVRSVLDSDRSVLPQRT